MLTVSGAAAAARLFHTLQIYIFTAAPESPACNVFTRQLNAQFFSVFRSATVCLFPYYRYLLRVFRLARNPQGSTNGNLAGAAVSI